MQNASKTEAHGSTKGITQSLTRADPENSETREGVRLLNIQNNIRNDLLTTIHDL